MNIEFEGTIKMINRDEYSKQEPSRYCNKESIHNKKFILLHHKTQNLEFEIFYYNPYICDESKENVHRNYYPGIENIDGIYINFNLNKTNDEHIIISTSQIPLFNHIYNDCPYGMYCPEQFDLKISYNTNTDIFEITAKAREEYKRFIKGHLFYQDVPIPTFENYQNQGIEYHKQAIVSGYVIQPE
jgi:hypothetical protein